MISRNKNLPPPFIRWILRSTLLTDELEEKLGDLEEAYTVILTETGKKQANQWYRKQVIPQFPRLVMNTVLWRLSMLKAHLKIFIRNMLKHKGFTFINTFGLSIGLACCIVILIYVAQKLSYDNYHENRNSIFRVSQIERTESHTSIDPNTAPPLAPALLESFPEVEAAARIDPRNSRLIQYEDKQFYEDQIVYADQALFDILTIPFVAGDASQSLTRPQTMVITESISHKYFGLEPVVGKILLVNGREFEITGVVADPPENTHFDYGFIGALKFEETPRYMGNWLYHSLYTYIRLTEDTDLSEFKEKMRFIGDRYAKDLFDKLGYSYEFFITYVHDLHLHPCPHGELRVPGNLAHLTIFSAIGVFVLLIACLNFVNLSTARSTQRGREIGLRKVVGARRSQLAFQFLGETWVMVMAALGLALLLVHSTLPAINNLAGLRLSTHLLIQHPVPLILMGLVFCVSLLSGLYPALLLSRFSPIATLHGRSASPGTSKFRNILVVLQFGISTILIIGSLTVGNQLRFMRHQELGFDQEQKLVIPIRGRHNLKENYQTVKTEFMKNPGILHASCSSDVFGEEVGSMYTARLGEDDDKSQSIDYIFIDGDFIPHFSIPVIAGRNFYKDEEPAGFILNDRAISALGWNSATEALGRSITTGTGRKGPVIGVVKDFHYQGLQNSITPLIFDRFPRMYSMVVLTLDASQVKSAMKLVQSTWKRLYPEKPFYYFFLDDHFNKQYAAEVRISRMMSTFTALGIVVACMGLFGLASFTVERRVKEIGIRKVLGASVSGISLLLANDFMKWVLWSNLFAWPIAFFIMNEWLNDFAYRTPIGINVFFVSACISLMVALLTVGHRVIKTARANPIRGLRYE